VSALAFALEQSQGDDDAEESVRYWASRALGDLGVGNRYAIRALLVTLRRADHHASQYAADALAKIGESATAAVSDALADADPHVRYLMTHALHWNADLARLVAPALERALRDEDKLVMSGAAEALAHAGVMAIPILCRVLEESPDKDGLDYYVAAAFKKSAASRPCNASLRTTAYTSAEPRLTR
jgi:HEAT repeat protein